MNNKGYTPYNGSIAIVPVLVLFALARPVSGTLRGESEVTQAGQPAYILYTHPDCAFSAAAIMDYRKRKIEFTQIDVSKQTDKIPELEQLTGGERLTPVMVENGTVIIGFKGGT